MVKKTKLFGVFFSIPILLISILSVVSCGSKVYVSNSSSKALVSENETNEISDEIKSFIKNKFYFQGDDSNLLLDNLLELDGLNLTQRKAEKREIVDGLNALDDELNKNSDKNKIELKIAKLINGLKTVVGGVCKNTSRSLKENFNDDFLEVKDNNILEIDETSLIFNLKKFSISGILEEIESDDQNDKISNSKDINNSKDLEIYNIGVDLKLLLNKGNGKKESIPFNDINLFVVLDQAKIQMLTEGITTYLQERVNRNVTLIYLDGTWKGKSNGKTKEYFSELLENKNFDLTNPVNKRQIGFYLSEIYLPGLIFKNYQQNEEKPVRIAAKELDLKPENLNLRAEGMEMDNLFQQEMNFLNFFGNQMQRQISRETINKISAESFLKDKVIYENQYYKLGSGILNVNEWTIRGFSIRPIELKFQINIMKDILETTIKNLKTFLNSLLTVMSKSSIQKRGNINGKVSGDTITIIDTVNDQNSKTDFYTVTIKSTNNENILETFKRELQKRGKKVFFDDILNALYIDKTLEEPEENFKSINRRLYHFSTEDANRKDFSFNLIGWGNQTETLYTTLNSSKNDSFLDEPLDIYFVFNYAFRIKLNDSLLVKTRKTEIMENTNPTGRFTNDMNQVNFN